ncbi:unnamed protein product, partial [Choristocarpus tenellus]
MDQVVRLEGLFQAGGEERVRTQLVFVSSCNSEDSGQAFVGAGVPHVVAVKFHERVTDQAAQTFSRVFYDALIVGRYTVQGAFDVGVKTVNATSLEGENFLLLPRGGNHDVCIFDKLPKGTFKEESRPLPYMVGVPAERQLFFGKAKLQAVVKAILERNNACVTITGERGMGKTVVAVQACHYVSQRHHFQAVLYAD